MTMSTFGSTGLAVLLNVVGAAFAGHAQAQSITLMERQTVLNGQYLVGFSTLGDSDRLIADSVALTHRLDERLESSGMVEGMVGNLPVFGTAGFMAQQIFDVGADGITVHGEARAEAEVGFAYVSAGADADSALGLNFEVAEATPFTLTGSLLSGGTLASAVVSLTPLTAQSSSFWRFDTTGAIAAEGVLSPGIWRIFALARADAGPGDFRYSHFDASLQLAPVPEPDPAWLLGCGLAVLAMLVRRRTMA